MFLEEPELPAESKTIRYVGILLCYVEAINPTAEQLIQAGMRTEQSLKEKPLNYVETDGKFRIDFYLKGRVPVNPNATEPQEPAFVRVRYSIWIKDELMAPSKTTGNIQVIGQNAKAGYVSLSEFTGEVAQTYQTEKGEILPWLEPPYVKARIGEANLNEFLSTVLCLKSEDDFPYYDLKAIAAGNLNHLSNLKKNFQYMKAVLSIRVTESGVYQNVFKLYRHWMQDAAIHNSIKKEYTKAMSKNQEFGKGQDFGFPHSDFGFAYKASNYVLRPHMPRVPVHTPQPPPDAMMPEGNELPTPSLSLANNRAEADDDLPF